MRRQDGEVELRVADNGIGIAPEFMPQIFVPFRQADGESMRRMGLGLGLAIARQLVELHGGTIQAQSLGLGLGTTFIVRMPLPVVDPKSSGPNGEGAAVPVARIAPEDWAALE